MTKAKAFPVSVRRWDNSKKHSTHIAYEYSAATHWTSDIVTVYDLGNGKAELSYGSGGTNGEDKGVTEEALALTMSKVFAMAAERIRLINRNKREYARKTS